jgi:hypothetical protein
MPGACADTAEAGPGHTLALLLYKWLNYTR